MIQVRQAKDCDRKLISFCFLLFCFPLLSQYTLAAHSGATLLPDIPKSAGTYAATTSRNRFSQVRTDQKEEA